MLRGARRCRSTDPPVVIDAKLKATTSVCGIRSVSVAPGSPATCLEGGADSARRVVVVRSESRDALGRQHPPGGSRAHDPGRRLPLDARFLEFLQAPPAGIPLQLFDPGEFVGAAIPLQPFGPPVGDADGLASFGDSIFVADSGEGIRKIAVNAGMGSLVVVRRAVRSAGSRRRTLLSPIAVRVYAC
jgi:hypothetical protein